MIIDIDPDAFDAWLRKGINPYRVVGVSGNANDCPLARYLSERNNFLMTVTVTAAWRGHGHWELPTWAQRFVMSTDKAGPRRRIRVSEARYCLRQALDTAD